MLPVVSIIMPVFNAERFIKETIDGILNQTLQNFEFIIADDGSTDNSVEIIKSYSDPRIKFYQNERNIGYVRTLNNMIDLSVGEYIARQDHDDISHRRRLEIQVDFLKNNPEVGLCGAQASFIGSKNGGGFFHAHSNEDIRAQMVFGNPIVHPSVMMRAGILRGKSSLRYNTELMPAEDYALWFSISKVAKLANIHKILLKYRWHSNNTGQKQSAQQIKLADEIRQNIIEETLSLIMTNEEKRIHHLACNIIDMNEDDLLFLKKWLLRLYEDNKSIGYYASQSFKKAILNIWALSCGNNKIISNSKSIRIYYSFPLLYSKGFFFTQFFKVNAKFLLKSMKLR